MAQLEATTHVPDKSIHRHLRALEQWDLVSRIPTERGAKKRGRPKGTWKLETGDLALRFANQADAFALELAEARASRLREAINARRRSDLAGENSDAA